MPEAQTEDTTKAVAMPKRKTAFARWMADMGYTNTEAARALGLSLPWVKELKRGARYNDGSPVTPDVRTRLAMRALAMGLKPWTVH